MSRIVIRLVLGMIFVIVASFLIVRCGAIQASRGDVQDHFLSHVNIVAKAHYRLNKAPAKQLDAELAALKRSTEHPIRVIDPSTERIPANVRRAWERNEPLVTWKNHKQGATVWLPIRNRSLLLSVERRPMRWHHGPLLWVVIALFSVVVLTGVALSWPLVRRMRKLERIADRISAGELDARADVSSKDALGRLARRFNAMADQVQLLLDRQRQLIQGVSHELRTPVARIRFGLEMLESAEDDDAREARIQSIDEDLTELDTLVGELLQYIKSRDRGLQLAPADLEARPVLTDLLHRQGELRDDVDCVLECDEALTVFADARHFRRALRNLLDNALRHARSQVTVVAERDGDRVQVAVEDDGPGVPEADRPRIFEPFSRLDASRSRESGGAGLGLAIVSRILEAHGGGVSVTEAAGGGARFETEWPDQTTAADTKRYKGKPKHD